MAKFKLSVEKIQVINVIDVLSETAIQFTLWPLDDGTSPLTMANELQAQLADPNSILRSGALTKNLDTSVFSLNVIQPLTNDGSANSAGKLTVAAIIGISVAVYVVIMLLFFGAYKLYKRRIQDDAVVASKERDNAKSWWYKDLHVDPSRHAELDSLLEFEAANNDGASFIDGVGKGLDSNMNTLRRQPSSIQYSTDVSQRASVLSATTSQQAGAFKTFRSTGMFSRDSEV